VGVILIDHNLEKTDNRLKKDIFYCQVNAGAALNLTEAVLRCLTERRQTPDPPEKLFINSGPDIIWKHWVLNMKKTYGKAVSIHNSEFRSYLTDRDLSFLLDGDAPMVSFEYLRKSFPRNSDFRDDVDYFTDLLKKENEELIVIDVQHPGIKFPAVWVIVPGMMWMRKSLINEDTVFLKYSLDDSWFEDADKIKSFIRTAEDYLKYNLYFPDVDTVFGTKVSLFRILAVCNFKIEKYDEALQYFEAAREVEGTSKYDVVISKLRNRDSIPANDAVLMKNPFVYGWDVEENALNMVIIPREVNRVMSCFYRHFAS
jgi:tetratricopeptide (TPR) repeat protein